MRVLWLGAGLLSLAIGIAGVFLPLVPTVPLMLLAAFCLARSSPRLHGWLVSHPTWGPPIQDWRDSGSIGRRFKWIATGSILATIAISALLGVGWIVITLQVAVLSLTLLYIWTRPETMPRADQGRDRSRQSVSSSSRLR